MMPEPVLFITGATGFIGSELLKCLLVAQPRRRIAALIRRPEAFILKAAYADVAIVQGDLRLPDLGLAASQLAELRSSIAEVIHCAAETRFNLPLSEARETNLVGTENLLKLARTCPRLEKFAYISTIYVAGQTPGQIAEQPIEPRPVFTNSYQQSKFEAEARVLHSSNDLPSVVFRLSSIVGDSRSGCVKQFNYVHHLLRLFPRNVLPMIPGNPAAPIDLIPTDWAIAALAFLLAKRHAAGSIYHLCAGGENSLTLTELVDLTRELFEASSKQKHDAPIRVPALVGLAEYQQFVEQQHRTGDRLMQELIRALDCFLPQLAFPQEFQNDRATAALADSGLRFPPFRDTYVNMVRYCLESNWGAQSMAAC